jgi:hypothetical protein
MEAMQATSNLMDIPGITAYYDKTIVLREFHALVTDYSLTMQSWVSIRNASKRISDSMLSDGSLPR